MGPAVAESTWPPEFRDLERFSEWCLETEPERSAKRQASTFEELQAFYDAVLPRTEEILTYLDKYPFKEIPAELRPLLQLTWALAEVAPAIEAFGQVQVVDGYDIGRIAMERRG